MPHPSQQMSNDQYLKGLRTADPQVLNAVYTEFRQPIVRAISAAGGSAADGAVFFRTALVEAARAEDLPDEVPFFFFLKKLSVAHLHSWQRERGMHGEEEIGEEPVEEYAVALPDHTQLQETRRHIFAWKTFLQLDPSCRDVLEISVGEGKTTAELAGRLRKSEADTATQLQQCHQKFAAALQEKGSRSLENEDPSALPAWAVGALQDATGLVLWRGLTAAEHRFTGEGSASGSLRKRDVTARNLFILLITLTLGYAAYRYFYHATTPAEVYKENFTPPAGLVADRQARYAHDSVPTELPEQCAVLFQEADALYQAKDYKSAQDPLLLIVIDTAATTQPCQSDAWFYLGILQLLQDEPGEAITCFAKIDNLEHFGEDLYWYQALALVQRAIKDPDGRDKARRAAERALENVRSPEKRLQVQRMLEQLGGPSPKEI